MTNYRKGYYLEYKMKNVLMSCGFWVSRIPKSGKNPDSPIDLIAIRLGEILGVECKRRSSDKFYLKELDLNNIKRWIKKTNGKFFLCLQFNGDKEIRVYTLNQIENFLKSGSKLIDINDKTYISLKSFKRMLKNQKLV